MDPYQLGQALARLEREEDWEPYLIANCPDPDLRTRLLDRRRALACAPSRQAGASVATVLRSAADRIGMDPSRTVADRARDRHRDSL
jgi:hypothetical protein